MSSAILYLAIVAIWACILVPRWVRRTHPVVQESPDVVTIDEDAGAIGAMAPGAGTVAAAGGETETVAAAVLSTLEDGPRWLTAGMLRSLRRLPAEPSDAEFPTVPAPAPPTLLQTAPAQAALAQAAAAQAAPVRPPVSRAAILQARRRMMTTLVTLVIAAFGVTAAGRTPWWICVPPAGMLGMYLLLLREAAHADADMHRRRMEARAARAARQRAREAWAAREPEPTAQIIDISSRVGDQLYDQYADATVRAVGD